MTDSSRRGAFWRRTKRAWTSAPAAEPAARPAERRRRGRRARTPRASSGTRPRTRGAAGELERRGRADRRLARETEHRRRPDESRRCGTRAFGESQERRAAARYAPGKNKQTTLVTTVTTVRKASVCRSCTTGEGTTQTPRDGGLRLKRRAAGARSPARLRETGKFVFARQSTLCTRFHLTRPRRRPRRRSADCRCTWTPRRCVSRAPHLVQQRRRTSAGRAERVSEGRWRRR